MGGKSSKEKKREEQQQKQKQQEQKKQQLSEGEKARMKLQHSRDQLRDKRKQVEIQVETCEKEIKVIRELIATFQDLIVKNRKEQAKFIIQRKLLYDKFLENILEKETIIAKSIQSMDQMISDKEMADIVTNTNQVMKDIQNSIDIDKVQDAVLDMEEMKQQQNQLQGLFQQYHVDEDEELNEMFEKYQTNEAKMAFQEKPQQQFVPLAQQEQKQQNVQVEEKNDMQEQLEMLE